MYRCSSCGPGRSNLGAIIDLNKINSAIAKEVQRNYGKVTAMQQNIVNSDGTPVYAGESAPKSGSYGGQQTTATTQPVVGPAPTVPGEQNDNTTLYVAGGLALAAILYFAFK